MPSKKPPKPYHHGNLRNALIAAAEQLMAEKSAWTLTLREVAREAGVSHNAPYSYFPDRLALLAAVAARSFAELAMALNVSVEAIDRTDAVASLEVTAVAYVTFALGHRSRFRLMFSSELAEYGDETLRKEGENAFAILREIVSEGISTGQFRADPKGTHALSAWAIVHGLSTLMLDGKIPLPSDPQDKARVVDAVASTLIEGLEAKPCA